MNTFGRLFRLTTFGESHGPALGAVVDGCPAGVSFSLEQLQAALDRRRPGQSELTTSRAEADRAEILSGLYQGKTLGTPIAIVVRNTDARSGDYAQIAREPRPGHADRVWRVRFKHFDPRGGGRTSGRETVGRVMGGAVAEALLARELPALRAVAWVEQVGALKLSDDARALISVTREQVDRHPTRCPNPGMAEAMASVIKEAKSRGESLGGAISLMVTGLPTGLGEPVFAKTKALLADAMLGIGSAVGISFGSELAPSSAGSDFHGDSAHYGGIQGGLTNGAPLLARILFKPPATLGAHALSGRHDPCILPRAVPVVEAMANLVLADLWLSSLASPHLP